MTKVCEVCQVEIPEDYQNALCNKCYDIQTKQNEQAKIRAEEESKASGKIPVHEEVNKSNKEHVPVNGITDPEYKTNPQQDEIDLVKRNYVQFVKSGKWLWHPTRNMYEFIRDSFIDIVKSHPQFPKFIWKPTVCDIGCGSGCGTNILSQEADFVWGIDKCEASIAFANELFKRNKNNIYYTPEIRFDTIDIENPPPNIDMKFDTVTAIEVFEHLEDHKALLEFIKSIARKGAIIWLSTPNRNNKGIQKDHPKNRFHVKEMTSQEFVASLREYFEVVGLYNSSGTKVEEDTTETPILCLCKNQS